MVMTFNPLGNLPFIPFSVAPAAVPYGAATQDNVGILLPQTATSPAVQAHNEYLQIGVAGHIQKLRDYLAANLGQYAQLGDAVRMVTRAVELYKDRKFDQADVQIQLVYVAIAALRATQANLPGVAT